MLFKIWTSNKSFCDQLHFWTNNAPEKGDLWSFGEIANSGDVYTNKASKLFKITGIERNL